MFHGLRIILVLEIHFILTSNLLKKKSYFNEAVPPSYDLSCGLCYTFNNARLWIPFQSISC